MKTDDEMLLSNWVKKTFTRIQLFDDVDLDKGLTVTNSMNRNLTMGLLSTNNVTEWRNLCFQYAPVGTIKNEIDEEYYNDKMLLLRNVLTQLLFDTKNRTLAEKYLKILEKRDKDHWADLNKATSITAKTDSQQQTLNITFV